MNELVSEASDSLKTDRLIVEVFDSNGQLVKRSYGASPDELLSQHRAGQCAPTCSWCHQALADEIGEDAAFEAMYQRCFGKPLPQPPLK